MKRDESERKAESQAAATLCEEKGGKFSPLRTTYPLRCGLWGAKPALGSPFCSWQRHLSAGGQRGLWAVMQPAAWERWGGKPSTQAHFRGAQHDALNPT